MNYKYLFGQKNSIESVYGKDALLNRFIVRDDKQYWDFENMDLFLEYFEGQRQKEMYFCEVIFGAVVQKLKFDIDAAIDKFKMGDLDDIIDSIIHCFYEQYKICLEPDDILLTTSNRADKYSYHIIINNYAVEDYIEAKNFTRIVYNAIKNKDVLDLSVNSRTQTFRMLYCYKKGKPDSIKRPERHKKCCDIFNYEDTIIQYVDMCKILPKKATEAVAPIIPLPNNKVGQILKEIPKKYLEGFVFNKRVNNFLLFRRISPSYCPICERVHENENSLIIIYNGDDNFSIKCRRNMNKQNTIKLAAVVANKLEDRDFEGKNIYCDKEIKPLECVKTLCVHAAMKMGKTNALIDYLERGNFNRIVFVSFRQAFSANIKQRFSDFVLYKDVKGDLIQDKIIVQNESLHRFKIAPGDDPPDLLILDESESIIEQFNSGLFRCFNECFAVFSWLVRYSKRLIAMDALMGVRTVNVLRRMRGGEIFYHKNEFKRAADDTYNITHDYNIWYDNLKGEIEHNNKIAIATNSLKEGGIIFKYIEGLFPNKKIIFYSSKGDGQLKKLHLADVNKYWTQYDILIYTPTISAGISFERHHFDKMFCYFVNLSCPAEICIQMMGRVRDVKDYYLFIQKRAETFNMPMTTETIKEDLINRRKTLYKKYEENFIDFTYTEQGTIIINENDYFYLWLENIKIKNASINHFAGVLINHISAAGAKIVFNNDEEVDSITETKRDVLQSIVNDAADKILDAADIKEERAKELRSKILSDGLSLDERFQYERFKLKQFYNIDDRQQLSKDFIMTYNNKNIRRHYRNLKKIYCMDTIEKSLKAIQDDERDYTEFSIMNGNDSFYSYFNNFRLSIVLLRLYGFNCLFDNKTVAKEEILRRNIKKYKGNLFDEIRIVSNNITVPLRANLEQMKHFLIQTNRIINYMFGTTIIQEKKKETYTLRANLYFSLVEGKITIDIFDKKN